MRSLGSSVGGALPMLPPTTPPPRRPWSPGDSEWSIELVGRRIAALQEEHRALRTLPGQLQQVLFSLEAIHTRLNGFGPGAAEAPPGSPFCASPELAMESKDSVTELRMELPAKRRPHLLRSVSTSSMTSSSSLSPLPSPIAMSLRHCTEIVPVNGSRRVTFRPNSTVTPRSATRTTSGRLSVPLATPVHSAALSDHRPVTPRRVDTGMTPTASLTRASPFGELQACMDGAPVRRVRTTQGARRWQSELSKSLEAAEESSSAGGATSAGVPGEVQASADVEMGSAGLEATSAAPSTPLALAFVKVRRMGSPGHRPLMMPMDSQNTLGGKNEGPCHRDGSRTRSVATSSAMSANLSCRISNMLSLGDVGVRSARRGSLSAEEIMAAAGHKSWMLRSNGKVRLSWDVLTILSIVFVAIAVPIRLAYFARAMGSVDGGDYWARILAACDVWWLLGVLLNFGTERVGVEDCPRRVAKRYARGPLWLDLLASAPLALFALYDRRTRLSEALSALRLVRLLRLGSLFGELQRVFRSPAVGKLKLALEICLLMHALACGWRITTLVDAADSDTVPELKDGFEAKASAYLLDFYFIFMTISTVGYGDVTARGDFSRLYAICTMLIGMVTSGTMVSIIAHFTAGFFNDKVENQVAETARFMAQRRISPALRARVETNLRRRFRMDERMLKAEIFDKLSPSVQRDLSLELLSDVVLKFPLFQKAMHSFVAEIAQAHTWVDCHPGDLIAEEGQLVQELAFVIQGRLVADRPCAGQGGHQSEEQELDAGAWFGEKCLFNTECVQEGAIVAIDDSELALLRASEYHRICEKYPQILERHQKLAREIDAGKLNARLLSYRPQVDRRPSNTPAWNGGRWAWHWPDFGLRRSPTPSHIPNYSRAGTGWVMDFNETR